MAIRDYLPWGRDDAAGSGDPDPLLALQGRINDVFEDFFGRPLPASLRGAGAGRGGPRVDVRQGPDELVVEVELPGVDPDDVEVLLTEDRLTIRGEKRTAEEHELGGGRVHRERTFGAFERTLPLPCEVLADGVDASFARGVLTVRLPRPEPEPEQVQRIPIRREE